MLGAELWSAAGGALGWKALRRLGRGGAAHLAGDMLVSGRTWLEEAFGSELTRGLLAPWALHAGLGPDAVMSGLMTKVISIALQDAGCPVPRGGSARLVDALAALTRDNGGELRTDCDVEQVLVGNGRAVGVRIAGGEEVYARRAVIANVTPSQLYLRLLSDAPVPTAIVERARHVRAGRASMQIHVALSEPPRWSVTQGSASAPISMSRPGLTACRARSTKPSAACCPSRRRCRSDSH